jgi:drug/metabolite transporter (DMT)-like permease
MAEGLNGRTRSWGLLWVAAGASLWGTDTVLRRPLTSELSSYQIVLIEHLILTLILLPVFWQARLRWLALGAREWAAVIGLSWGGSALGTVLFTEAVRIGNPTTAVLLQKTQPLFTALLAYLLIGERIGRRFWVALLAALCGAWLVSFGARSPWQPLRQAEWMAPLFALGAAGLWGASTVFGRFVLRRVSFSTLTALRIIAATPFLGGIAFFHPQAAWKAVDARQALWLLLMALIPGLLALLIYYRGLGRTQASLASVAELSFPATATLLNWVVLRTHISVTQVVGFVLLWGVIFSLEKRHG